MTQRRNQVSFDPAKESAHIVSHAQPYGDPFKLLGICFDCKLRMDLAVRDVVSQAFWKLGPGAPTASRNLCKFTNRRSFRLLSTAPLQCDAVQRRFRRECGLSDEEALPHFNLAPLETRRDIAMLGLTHRSARDTLRKCFCPLRRRLPRNLTNNFYHTGALVICKFCHALQWDSLMSTICYPLRWFARRV